jgi:hypothetical protein
MIAERYITEWSKNFPWIKNSFVEQDMVICRALVDIFSDPFLSGALAFRGGTAIHKLHFSPQVRYSEDIDLVQVEAGPVKPITERLSEVLSWLPRKTTEMRRFGFRMKFRYNSELAPIEPMRLKVEVDVPTIVRVWREYMRFRGGDVPTAKQFAANMDEKMALNDYLGDVEPFLRSGVSFNPHQAYAEFKKNVLPLI